MQLKKHTNINNNLRTQGLTQPQYEFRRNKTIHTHKGISSQIFIIVRSFIFSTRQLQVYGSPLTRLMYFSTIFQKTMKY